jgi:adenylate cyclase, class 2
VRLRTDGRTTTLTLKVIHHATIDGTEETEVVVDSFDTTHNLLIGIGLSTRSYQENYRTTFELAGAQVTIDEWPLVPPWVEVEGDSKEQVERVFSLLGIPSTAIISDDVSSIFEKRYGIKIDEIPRLTFG